MKTNMELIKNTIRDISYDPFFDGKTYPIWDPDIKNNRGMDANHYLWISRDTYIRKATLIDISDNYDKPDEYEAKLFRKFEKLDKI